jgi:hypothetical protein
MRSNALPPMRDLLERAGFRIRSANRADCAHCRGRSIRTVGYTTEVAHCFRCGWAANRVRLARELGLFTNDPVVRERLHVEARHRRAVRLTLLQFQNWRDGKLRLLSEEYKKLGEQAAFAHRVLLRWPDCEPAWDALARFYHAEAGLLAALDFLTFAKASDWLESDATPVQVFETWRRLRAAT